MIHASLIYTEEKLFLFGWSESLENDFSQVLGEMGYGRILGTWRARHLKVSGFSI